MAIALRLHWDGDRDGRMKLLDEQLLDHILVTESCWLWTSSVHPHYGYPLVRLDGKNQKAHRLLYELLVGPVPEGLVLDHLCRVRHCVRPAHLEPVTNRVNILRGESPHARNARKTHCPQNHPYDEANTRYKRSRGHIERICKTCANDERRRRYHRKMEALRSQA